MLALSNKTKYMEKDKKDKLDISSLIWYFLIFSILGLVIETLYCYITTGVLESRQGLLYGPFCPIYGCGAVVCILFLNKYKNSIPKLFFSGAILGSIVEYILSYGMEAIYGNRFWDYSYTKFHLNGRISLTYTIFWAILAVVIIKYTKPLIDNLINKIKINIRKKIEVIIIIFFIIDALLTIWAVKTYTLRAQQAYYNSIENDNTENPQEENIIKNIENKLFSNKKMIKTFPNIRIKGIQGEEIFARTVFEKNN